MPKELRPYQIENLKAKKIPIPIIPLTALFIFAMEVRTGKTVTAFETAKLLGAKKVILTTKKKAIKY